MKEKLNSKLSVILPNYNHAVYLRGALEAIWKQSLKPLEVIVIDDASTDNSVEIVEELKIRYPGVVLIKHDKNQGAVLSIKEGLEAASGDYVYLASSDDKVLPDFFQKSLDLLDKYPQAGLCCSDPGWWKESGEVCITKFGPQQGACYLSPQELMSLTCHREFGEISTQTAIFERKAILEAGGIRIELEWNYDWFLCYVVAFRRGLCYLPENLTAFRLMSQSWSQQGSKHEKQSKVMNRIFELIKSEDYRDVLGFFKESYALAIPAVRFFKDLFLNKEGREFLTLSLLRRIVWKRLKRFFAHISPAYLKNVYRHFRYPGHGQKVLTLYKHLRG